MLILLAVVSACAPTVSAEVWITVLSCDETTRLEATDPNHPMIQRNIMVGTHLVLLLTSDAPGVFGDHRIWAGFLQISWDDWQRGTLSARGYNQQSHNYDGSCLPAAGSLQNIKVRYFERFPGVQFDLAPDYFSFAGDWFVFDYYARQVGTCTVGLYEPFVSVDVPIQTLSFTHVPSADFNGDTLVNFQDLAVLASHWRAPADPNGPGAAFDLNADGRIDTTDLVSFSDHWLERTDCTKTATDPNEL